MLKFQDPNQVVDAEQVRVSAAELVQALRTVDESKEAEARLHADTIPLGQAIAALGVTYTPEEVLEALQAHRARQDQLTAQTALHPKRRRMARGVLAAVLLSVGIASVGLWSVRSAPPPVFAPTSVVTPSPISNPTASLQTKSLGGVVIGETFHCDTATLFRLAKGTAGANTVVEVGSVQNDLWIATRGASGFEVQGWTTPSEALKIANGEAATFYRSAEQFSSTSPITAVRVPLERLKNVSSSPTEESYVSVSTIPQKPR